MDDDRLLTENETMAYLNMSRSFLAQARMNCELSDGTEPPPYLKVGDAIRYRKSELDAWLDTKRVG